MVTRHTQVWSPHNLPSSAAESGALQPLRLTRLYTLLRVLHNAPALPAESAAMIAEWPTTPPCLPNPLNTFQLPFLCLPIPQSLLVDSTQCEAHVTPHLERTQTSHASPSDDHETAVQRTLFRTPWLIVEVKKAFGANQCGEVNYPESAAFGRVEELRLAQNRTRRVTRRLRLGALLYAPTWRPLFKRHNRAVMHIQGSHCDRIAEATGKYSSTTLSVTGEESAEGSTELATAADREALALLFPAFHYGLYFATPREFENHCLYSDDHLLWCEKEPLMTVELTSTENGCEGFSTHIDELPEGRKIGINELDAERSHAIERPTCGDANLTRCPSNLLRKRRRAWLSELRGVTLAEREPRMHLRTSDIFSIQQDVSCSRQEGHWIAASAGEDGSVLFTTPCAYVLTLPSVDELTTTLQMTNLPLPSPMQPSADYSVAEEKSFAAWCGVLRLPCHAVRASLERSFEAKSGVYTPHQLREAALEVVLHGIVVSLALWCSEHDPNLCVFVSRNVEIVALLVRNWWWRFWREASQPPPIPAPLSLLAERRKIARLVSSIFRWDCLAGRLPTDVVACGSSNSEELRANQKAKQSPLLAPVPSFLSTLVVSCAAAITRHHRRVDRSKSWSAAHPLTHRGSPTSQEFSSESLPTRERGKVPRSNGGATTDSSLFAPSELDNSNPLRLSREEGRQQRERYNDCMNLVMQLLFAEQQSLLSATAEQKY